MFTVGFEATESHFSAFSFPAVMPLEHHVVCRFLAGRFQRMQKIGGIIDELSRFESQTVFLALRVVLRKDHVQFALEKNQDFFLFMPMRWMWTVAAL